MKRIAPRISLLLFSGILCLAIGSVGASLFDSMLSAPVVYVDVEGDLDDRELAVVRRELSAEDLSSASIRDLKPVLEEMGWIHHVNVKKVWPDVLKVRVVKQKAVAKWRADNFLNGEGEVFNTQLYVGTKLPDLNGPPGAERVVMSQYQQLNKALQKTGLAIQRLTLEDRGEWVLQLKNQIVVKLGKEDIFERMQRFIKVYEAVGLDDKVGAIAEIDTRYPNGVAVSWKDDTCTDGCYEFAGNDNLKRKQTL
ncbi:MAG: cell division protein FtsQ/DivIB [Pseudomonadales bacterium]|jgi:cell division protein FtsQ|nr:cell division protein FtsQ/DivIB [Pseudomonadales bacterium]MDP7144965.1 cell division protein FtsQ/DivIB [Pseudomonadales bacterium]MDP7357147.1 cell division protein FtsQ/DivIB [Pseudomonadales bacterium]MDP7594790.1 cell division protein FtsQ/DivIB [Pseudomonadales bacterium]HJN50031.1 cell division protein FtsQ/DivIB [Pseudomonadales bacterium]|tara:strand:- start:1408 stop:2163 length:756 start_codon:yes stop_codon:yes gene_type:complete